MHLHGCDCPALVDAQPLLHLKGVSTAAVSLLLLPLPRISCACVAKGTASASLLKPRKIAVSSSQ